MYYKKIKSGPSPPVLCWSLNPQHRRRQLCLEIHSFRKETKLKCHFKGTPNPTWLLSLNKMLRLIALRSWFCWQGACLDAEVQGSISSTTEARRSKTGLTSQHSGGKDRKVRVQGHLHLQGHWWMHETLSQMKKKSGIGTYGRHEQRKGVCAGYILCQLDTS